MSRTLHKRGIPARNATLAFAPLVAAYLVGAERVTLGGSLNLLWLLLTAAAVIHCLEQRVSRAARTQQLFSLALVLALFFPVISLDDDRALAELPRELQTLVSPAAKQKAQHAIPVLEMPVLAAAPLLSTSLRLAPEGALPALPAPSQCACCQASGNHSPPLA